MSLTRAEVYHRGPEIRVVFAMTGIASSFRAVTLGS
jgi:hypothetical protein